MDFKQLKELSINEQIVWLNDRLLEGNTVAQIRDRLCIGEKALQKHIKSINYKYDQKLKQYVSKDYKQDDSNTLALQLSNSEYQKFMNIMNTYEELQNQVQSLIKRQELEENIIDITLPKLEITPMKKKPISKTYKFDPDVIKEFTTFCNKHKNYKVQDIISKALQEFIEKYGD